MQNLNGYLPSTTSTNRSVTITAHPYNDQTGNTGLVRLKTVGLAKYETMIGTGGNTTLTAIMECAISTSDPVFIPNIGSVSNHKLLCTIAYGKVNGVQQDDGDSSDVGSNWCKFTQVNINGTAVPLSSMTFEYEHATFPAKSDGTVTINVTR